MKNYQIVSYDGTIFRELWRCSCGKYPRCYSLHGDEGYEGWISFRCACGKHTNWWMWWPWAIKRWNRRMYRQWKKA